MEQPDSNTVVIAGVIAAILIAEMRLLRRELKIYFAAVVERSRRRDQRKRRDSDTPQVRRRSGVMNAVPEAWTDDDETDIHVLMDLERENQRSRRKTGEHRPGERKPRPGTHHDR